MHLQNVSPRWGGYVGGEWGGEGNNNEKKRKNENVKYLTDIYLETKNIK